LGTTNRERGANTPVFLSFEDATDYYLTEGVWYVGTSEGVLSAYAGTAEETTALALNPNKHHLFEH
jgi:hypothetical protein